MKPIIRILLANTRIYMAIGGVFLLGTMVIIMTNIVSRKLDHPVYGIYEWVEFLMIPVVSAALGYAELRKGHVSVSIVQERLNPRTQGFISSFNSFVSIIAWAVVMWVTVSIGIERVFERSLVHKFILLPFRIVFAYGIFCWCLVLVVDFIEGIRKGVNK